MAGSGTVDLTNQMVAAAAVELSDQGKIEEVGELGHQGKIEEVGELGHQGKIEEVGELGNQGKRNVEEVGELGNQGIKRSFEQVSEGKIPGWVDLFLQKTFFGNCENHSEFLKNELNRYCITCNEEACRLCVTAGLHPDHLLLKIHRHVYKDVVPLQEMVVHMDCSDIQPFKCNKKMVVSLNPLPHSGSGELYSADESCSVCKRKLSDSEQYCFCSLACKVFAFRRSNPNHAAPAESSTNGLRRRAMAAANSGQKKMHRRKGIPRRAPLF